MDALEARKSAQSINDERFSKELIKAQKGIQEAISKGHFEYEINGCVSDNLIEYFKGLGYTVDKPRQSGYNETSVKITW